MKTFRHKTAPLLIGLAFFALIGLYIIWDAFLAGRQRDVSVFDLTPAHPATWIGLASTAICLTLFCGRLTFRREVVILDERHLRLGPGGSTTVEREDVVALKQLGERIVIEARNLPRGRSEVVVLPLNFDRGDDLFEALTQWHRPSA